MRRNMMLPNRREDGVRMADYLRNRGVPTRVSRDGGTVFLPEMTRLDGIGWHLRQMLNDKSFGLWRGSDIKLEEQAGTVLTTMSDLFSGTQRVVAVPCDGTIGNKFYQGKEGSLKEWPDPSQTWLDLASTLADLANEGALDEQVCHPAIPVGLRREILIQGVFFEGALGPDKYLVVRRYDGRPLRAVDHSLPVEVMSKDQSVDRYLVSDGVAPEAEIVVTRAGLCQIRFRRSMVGEDGRAVLVIDPNHKPWVGDYNRAPYKFREAAKEAFVAATGNGARSPSQEVVQ